MGVGAGIRFSSRNILAPTVGLNSAMPRNMPSDADSRPLEDATAKDPNNLQALVALGNRYFDARQFQKAIDMYARALKIDPTNPDVRTDMAIMYRGLKDYDRAISELREAAVADPRHINSRYNLGIILLHDKGDVKGAIAAWEDCLKAGAAGDQADNTRQQIKALRDLTMNDRPETGPVRSGTA